MDDLPLWHGRLLRAGHLKGARDIGAYDAACLALAEAEQRYNITEFTYNPEGVQEFRSMMDKILRPPEVTGAVQSVEQLKAQMAAKAAARTPKPTE